MDPLKPLSQVLEALRSRHTAESSTLLRTGAAATSVSAQKSQVPTDHLANLERELRTQLTSAPSQDTARAREIFVKTVLATELGSQVGTDPGFNILVTRVVAELTSNATATTELDMYLAKLQKDS